MTARPKTQKPRVLRALERAGRHGVDCTQFLGPDTIDGGPPILNLAGRINELRADGYCIEVRGDRRNKCVVYRFQPPAAVPAPVSDRPPPAPDVATALFKPPASPPGSPYDLDREAS